MRSTARKIIYMDGLKGMSTAILILFLSPACFAQSAPMQQADQELEAGHYKAACDMYRTLLANHQGDVPLLIKLSKAMEGAGNLDEAIRRAREATMLDPNSAEAHLALGHYLESNREEKSAVLQFERVLELKGNAERKEAYLALLHLLIKDPSQGKYTLKLAQKCAGEFPKDPDAHYIFGLLLLSENRRKEGEQELTKFIALAPQDDPDLAGTKAFLGFLGQMKTLDSLSGSVQSMIDKFFPKAVR